MFSAFFNIVFFRPLYNALVFLSGIVPGHDIGLAIITLTVLVKLAIFPLYHSSLHTQRRIKELEPELNAIKEKFPDKQERAVKTMELYRANKVNPFAGFLVLLIQIPIVFALFYVFRDSAVFKSELLYSFVSLPASVDNHFLGLVDLTAKSVILALLTGATQYIQMRLSLPPLPTKKPLRQGNFKDDLARSMHLQMKYVMPVIMAVVALGFPAALALYWLTSNLFAIGHELLLKKKITH